MYLQGTEHQENVIPSNSSTSQLELSGTKSVTSLQSTASWQANSEKNSSQESITHLPPTVSKVSASIIIPPTQGHCHISGVHSPGTGVPSDGGGIATPCQTPTSHRLPPARRVDPQRVLAQGHHVTPVSCGRGSPPSGAQDPHGVDPWERWTPPPSEASSSSSCPEEAEKHASEARPSEPNRTIKTCTVWVILGHVNPPNYLPPRVMKPGSSHLYCLCPIPKGNQLSIVCDHLSISHLLIF